MIYKGTFMIPADRCGVWWVKVFQLYFGFCRKVSTVGNFVKSSVKNTRARNRVRRKSKPVGMVVRVRKELIKVDGSFLLFPQNNVVLLKKRTQARGKEIFGPTTFFIKRRKISASFSKMV